MGANAMNWGNYQSPQLQQVDMARPVNDMGASYLSSYSGTSPNQYGMAMPGGASPNLLQNPGPAGGSWLSQDSMFGSEQGGGGWVTPAIQTMSGLSSAWMGMQQYGLAKDALKESKRQFNLNYDAQKKSYNQELEGRQNARLDASGGKGYASTADTMKKYGL